MGSLTRFGIGFGVLIATIAPTQAEPPTDASAGQGGPSRWADRRDGMAARRADFAAWHAEREAKREADLALLLDLKPQQQSLLHAFLTATARPHGPIERDGHDSVPRPARPATWSDQPNREDTTFAARLADMQAHLDRRTQEEQARLAAARAFYASLDSRQQQKFEAIQRLHHPRDMPLPRAQG